MKHTLIILLYLAAFGALLQAEPPAEATSANGWNPTPREIKGLYLSFWGAGSAKVNNRIANLRDTTEINTVIIDIKNEYGYLSYEGNVTEAREIGAYGKTTIDDIDAYIAGLKQKGFYIIGRMVVFKDHLFATRHPNLAIHNAAGEVWINNEKLAWGNPASSIVRDYNVKIAGDAARHGFDEINFDYIRFPATRTIRFGKTNNQHNRVGAISAFLKQAKKALEPTGVKISVDTYGYVCWNSNDTGIGQKLEELEKYADFICPMLYPSGFHLGIPEYKDPMSHIYETVLYTLEKAYERTGIERRRFRPWLQAFRDYSFDKRPFRGTEIRKQITATEDFGAGGWLLWHPASYFVADGLRPPDDGTRVVLNNEQIEPGGDEALILLLKTETKF